MKLSKTISEGLWVEKSLIEQDRKSLVYHFYQQVNLHPSKIALIEGNNKLTYLQLDVLSDQLANELILNGVQKEEIVAILLPRSAQFIISVLAIIKAGAAYLPIHLNESESRMKHMLTETKCKVILSEKKSLNENFPLKIISPQKATGNVISTEKPPFLSKKIFPSQLAYVMYTSGSTGTPKGVCITHHSISSFVSDPMWNLKNQDRVLFHSQVAFDAATFEIWVPLLKGGTIIVAKEDSFNVDYLTKLINDEKVTSAFFTVTLFNLLAKDPKNNLGNMKQILVGGEQCSSDFIYKMKQKLPDTEIVNCYGPTETTTFFSTYTIPSNEILKTIPIGKPMDNMNAYVLNKDFEIVPEKEIGELYISSNGLAQGYLNQPALTAEKFLPDPFGLEGSRMYKTGDLVYWNEKRELVFIGRKDQQVKVRGFRVELGEIEEALQSHPNVSQAAVVAQRTENGNVMRAYIVPDYNASSDNEQLMDEQLREWEKIYDEVYQESDLETDTDQYVGWNSSFEDNPIERSHMDEWLENTLKSIRNLKPKKVLEIGIGTGMLLKHLYSETEIYWGTDLSETVINKLKTAFKNNPLSDKIKLFHQTADSIDQLPKQMFDTIIINSVCQYFPDIQYFTSILQKAMHLLSPSGKIFVGDIRDFRLQRQFYSEVHLHNKKIDTTTQLIAAIERDVMMESELLISPSFFSLWSKKRTDVAGFETKLKDGNFINEMSQYRYDAVIYKKPQDNLSFSGKIEILDWNKTDFQDLKNILSENKHQSLRITEIPNERIVPSCNAYEMILNNENLETIRNAYTKPVNSELKFKDFQVLAEENNYNIKIVHSHSAYPDIVDIIFTQRSFETTPLYDFYQDQANFYNLENCANYPPISRKINQLLIQLKTHLQKKLPDYMLPSTIIPINKMPLTSRGKINKEALLALNSIKNSDGRKASTDMEAIVCQLFAETLGLSEVLPDENFFEMGGNSLSVVVLTNRLRDVLNIEIPIKTFFENPTASMLIKKFDFNSQIDFPVQKQDRPHHIPLSFSQQRLWFLFDLEGPNETYSIPFTVRLSGKLNKTDIADALNDVVERHESLRTTFYKQEGIAYQHVKENAKVTMEVINVNASNVDYILDHASKYAFNLSEEIPITAKLLSIDETTHILLIIIHHIAFDGWSFAPFWKDLSAAYSARLQKKFPHWDPLPVQYIDFALWQKKTFTEDSEDASAIDRQLSYWKKNLNNLPALVSLPTDYYRPEKPSYNGKRRKFTICAKLHQDLLVLSQNHNVTLFMTIHAGLCCLLSRFNVGNDIVIGAPIAGRKNSEIKDLIGFFVNNLVLRVDTSGNPTFQILLKKVKEQDLSAYAHQDIPFERLVQELKQSGNTSWNPIFQIVLAFQNKLQTNIDIENLESQFELMENKSCRFDMVINLFAEESSNKDIEGFIEYNTDIFKASTIDHFVDSYISLLESIAENPEQEIDTIKINPHEIIDLTKPKIFECTEKHFASLFQEQANLTPENIALIYKENILTYKELKSAVNKLARLLISKGIGAEQIVAISLPRSIDWIVACLAVLESGAAYMPIDKDFPQERIKYMLKKSTVSVLLTTAELQSFFSACEVETIAVNTPEIIDLIDNLPDYEIEEHELTAPLLTASPAYIIYTSGSSGVPKPVVVTHTGITQIVEAQKKQYKVNESSRVLLFASQSFDGFFWELCSLLTGANLILADVEMLTAGKNLINTITEYKVTHATLPPAVLNLMDNEKMTDLKVIIVSGEAPNGNMLTKWTHNRSIINGYGPTESTVCTTLSKPFLKDAIPDIGHPIANTEVFVLDKFLEPVPVGVCGELYISGSGLARGYQNEPAMTAERFLPNPFRNNGSRMYRTGDLVRWTPEHHLIFMGRADNQIKIRGFLIEPHEIESVLEMYPEVVKAAVKLTKDILGNSVLKAYVSLNDNQKTIRSEKLRDFLKKTLPSYMIPSMISVIKNIPLTKNGKINYSGLNNAVVLQPDDHIHPATPTETKLLHLFSELLDIKEIGTQESFFDLGGHSLLAAKLISRIYQECRIDLPIGMIFQYPTIAELGKIIDMPAKTSLSASNTDNTLYTDARIADSIIIDPGSYSYTDAEPKSILLTGATGFLGASLINSLSTKYSNAILYCLVRASSVEAAKQRILKNLSDYRLEHLLENNRIVPLCGDLSADNLGLSSEKFSELAEKLDCIYHNGAKISSVSSYEELKKTNIKGTYEILRLAALYKTKPIYYVSTLAAAFNSNKPKKMLPEYKRLKADEILPNGYTKNKWVEEEMLLSAHKKGLPVSIFRPGRISGLTKNGIGNQNDALWQLVAAMLVIEAVPVFKKEKYQFIDLIPVDYVADSIVHFSGNHHFIGNKHASKHGLLFG